MPARSFFEITTIAAAKNLEFSRPVRPGNEGTQMQTTRKQDFLISPIQPHPENFSPSGQSTSPSHCLARSMTARTEHNGKENILTKTSIIQTYTNNQILPSRLASRKMCLWNTHSTLALHQNSHSSGSMPQLARKQGTEGSATANTFSGTYMPRY